jgi:4-amino-4-deoxy-L-arabinose transferase-like glycosyltransferase
VSRQAAYRLLVCALLVALTVPRMAQRGMFGDGVMYAVIARNMSLGVGSLWQPRFTETAYQRFFEQPPLGLGVESLAFRLLGDHVVVERLFSLLCFGLQALLIAALWRRLMPSRADWWPVFLWVLPSIVTWCVVNNMLENTQALFTSAAVLAFLVGGSRRAPLAAMSLGAVAGLLSVAAVLTKGPVGLFPLALPVLGLALPASHRPRHVWAATAGMAIAVAGAIATVWLYEPAHTALAEYFRTQLEPSVTGERAARGTPTAGLAHLGLGVVLRIAVLGAIGWLVRGRPRPVAGRAAVFYLAVAIAASLPILFSAKQVGHYFLPSVPFFALAIGALTPGSEADRMWLPSRWRLAVPIGAAVALLAAAVLVPIVRGPVEPRDVALIRALDGIEPALPRGATIGACRASGSDWSLQAYAHRFFRISLAPTDQAMNGLLLQAAGACEPPPDCIRLVTSGTLSVFRCSGSPRR